MDESGNPEAEIVLIAGMGGHLAIRLLEQSIDKCRKMKYIILQIQSDIEFVRNRIRELGFCINDEAMVLDEGKYYTAIRIVPVSNSEIHSYSEKELRYGPVLLKKRPDILKEYLRFKRDGYESIASKISANAKSIDVSEKTADIIREIEIIDECLEDF